MFESFNQIRQLFKVFEAENIKLNDNLQTQNNLLKIWLQKFDEPSSADKEKIKQTKENYSKSTIFVFYSK